MDMVAVLIGLPAVKALKMAGELPSKSRVNEKALKETLPAPSPVGLKVTGTLTSNEKS